MPIWKFTQSVGKAGEIEATTGLSVGFESNTPQRGIIESLAVFASSFEADLLSDSIEEILGLSSSFDGEIMSGTLAGTVGLFDSFDAEYAEVTTSSVIAIDVSFDADLLLGEMESAAGLSVSFDGTLPIKVEAEAEIGLSGEFEVGMEYLGEILPSISLQVVMEALSLTDIITAGIGTQGVFQGNLEASRENENTAGLSASFDGFNWTEFLRLYGDQAVKRYFCTLTGAEDGLDDVVIPIASFQTRIRNQEPTFLSVSIPGLDQADDISNRPNGHIVIDMAYFIAGVEMHREEIVRTDLETIDIHEGGTNSSIVLSGHKTIDWGGAKTVPLSGVTYRRTTNGITRLRTAIPDLYLKPGDFASYDEDTITVDQISIFVGPSMSSMEIAGQ